MNTSKKLIAAAAIALTSVGVVAPVGITMAQAASTPDLKQGATGRQVTALQHLLRASGSTIAADGSFGPSTDKAVRTFQARNGLKVDGVAGPATQAKLARTVRLGSKGEAVKAAQTLLTASGQPVNVDGNFGPKTRDAAIAFQKARGLVADGLVGPKTFAALFGATAPSNPKPPTTPPAPTTPPQAGDVTRADLEKMFPGKLRATSRVQEGLPRLNEEMRKAGIDTPARKAAFLATLAHESGFDYAIGEIGYDPYTYRGRGYIQITGSFNYRDAGNGIGVDLMGKNQVNASRMPYSQQIATWYWTKARPNSNAAADRFDMGKISTYVGYRASSREDAARCASFKSAYKHFSGKEAPASTVCYRH